MSKQFKRAGNTTRFMTRATGLRPAASAKPAHSRSAREALEAAAKDKAELVERARAAIEAMTDEEDAEIRAAALTDPDNLPDRTFKRRGRPPAAFRKEPVLLRLDPDVVEHFKAGGHGWQTRMNDALRKAAGLK